MSPELWDVTGAGHVFETFEGKQSLYLFRSRANLKTEVEFLNGIIEYDIFVTERRGFPGVRFRIQDAGNFEEFYIRPHQSGNPDANQYTPVFNGLTGWQLYYGSRYAAPVTYKMNAWNHIKLVIVNSEAEVYINDMEQPALYIAELKRDPASGSIGFNGGGPSPFHVADLKITKVGNPVLKSKRTPMPDLEEGVIRSWQVSNSFPEKKVDGVFQLGRDQKQGLTWENIDSEFPGYANLARFAKINAQNNTTFAKVIITSDKEQVRKLTYGFSDRVRVYLNDKILAGGNDRFTSRDYRFLGTMGYFDEVYLPLKKGKNELWVAVTENFGGWAVMARFDNQEGIKVD
ncbi:hypothetical protein [Roseivirga sp. E12]|uniref:hypothetical protein n=1 Tax=Roseivirga sp. E12 TaxID=2819237 RepID=UPI001ABC6B54|nr:hypothetical protein [Roseivirga sp. E12]MBO3696852.1 hypothetical protein [Roseivirga sp. E12]